MDLTFGWRTAVLSVACAILVPLAISLWRSLRNRRAARALAAFLIVIVGILTPWLIGFAGFYDQWQWLTFAPFSNILLVPPLLYLHAHALVQGRWPERPVLHLAPGAVQFAYQSACFLLPMDLKDRWADLSFPVVGLIVALAFAVSTLWYGRLIASLLARYRAALEQQRSDAALFAGEWLTRSAAAIACLSLIWATYLLVDAVYPLGYLGLMPLYVAIAAFALYLGITGWRSLALPFPTLADLTEPKPEVEARDWRALGREWAARTQAEGWHRDEQLGLNRLAALLGTNASYLSRALNEGLGTSFSTFINGLRCNDVAAAIRAGDPRSLLDLAHDAGFASKASFNRCFVQRFGVTPSAMRTAQRMKITPPSGSETTGED